MGQISWDDFMKVDIRVGTVEKVEDFPEARNPAYKLFINFGEEIGLKCSSVQITQLYKKEDLLSKQIIAVVNFPPKRIGPFVSEVLVTGFYNESKMVVIATPERNVPNGAKLF